MVNLPANLSLISSTSRGKWWTVPSGPSKIQDVSLNGAKKQRGEKLKRKERCNSIDAKLASGPLRCSVSMALIASVKLFDHMHMMTLSGQIARKSLPSELFKNVSHVSYTILGLWFLPMIWGALWLWLNPSWLNSNNKMNSCINLKLF